MGGLLKIFMFMLLMSIIPTVHGAVELGVDQFFEGKMVEELRGKRVALVTNHTGVNKEMRSTIDLCAKALKLVTLFSPEHGLTGHFYAFEEGKEKWGPEGIPVYNLQGKYRRPSQEMLKGIDVILYDIQDIGCRTYTYTTTLFYMMEEAAKYQIPVIVFDRPNPINGLTIDGPMMEENWRSFIGHIDIPYCHGMTVGELARYFNDKYQVGCQLKVIPMKGWKRSMSYADTGLQWIPTSPHIPEADTPLYYATSGILGEISLVNIGIGYTLPFKVIGAPWIVAAPFAQKLNEQKLPGVKFLPFHYRPFYGLYKGKDCQGVMILVTDPKIYRPVTTQYMILGILKNFYPKQVSEKLKNLDPAKKNLFCKANGNEEMFEWIQKEKYIAWKLIEHQKGRRERFRRERKPYLLYSE